MNNESGHPGTIPSRQTTTFSYIGLKVLICFLLQIPAFAVTLLIALFFGVASGTPEDAAGLLPYARAIAAFAGLGVFFAGVGRTLRKAQISGQKLSAFLAKESAAYGIFLGFSLGLLFGVWENSLQSGYLPLFFLSQGAPAYLGSPLYCLLLLPVYTLLLFFLYRWHQRHPKPKSQTPNLPYLKKDAEKDEVLYTDENS